MGFQLPTSTGFLAGVLVTINGRSPRMHEFVNLPLLISDYIPN